MQITARSRPQLWPIAVAALSAAWLALAPVANAQTVPAAPDQSGQQTPAAIPDQKLDAAAAALERVTSVRREYQEKINTSPDDDQQRIAAEANTAMSKAVTDQGLSLEEFNSIIRVAQNDAGVREKILQRVGK